MSRRRVAVVLVDRANYGRLEPVMYALKRQPEIQLLTIVGGTMVLERFGRPLDVVTQAGFHVDAEVYQELEGSTPATMAKSVGIGVTEYAHTFHRLKPDMVVLIGDRYEAFAAAIAAAYMNICLVHLQGGEVSGSIDESARHAITKLAHYHFPSTQRAADFIVRMGEDPKTILGVGCPSSDLAHSLDLSSSVEAVNLMGAGSTINFDDAYILAVYHPTTTEYGTEGEQIQEVLDAIGSLKMPTVMLWPNIDAGSDRIAKKIRQFRQHFQDNPFLRMITNLEPKAYLNVLARAACAVGNSSSFVRDAGFFGTPVVLVGRRQEGRECDEHVRAVGVRWSEILVAMEAQLNHGRYPPSTLYGDGDVARRVAHEIAQAPLYVQKRLCYTGKGDPSGPSHDAYPQAPIDHVGAYGSMLTSQTLGSSTSLGSLPRD